MCENFQITGDDGVDIVSFDVVTAGFDEVDVDVGQPLVSNAPPDALHDVSKLKKNADS